MLLHCSNKITNISHCCRYNWSDPKYALLLSQDPEATEDFFNVTAPSLSETILSCSVYQIQYNCADLFTVVKTAQGKVTNKPWVRSDV